MRNEKRRLEDKAGPGESIVAENSHFEGKIHGTEGVRILGNFKGEIYSKQLVRVGKKGKIEGTINSPYVIIEGELNGNIDSAEHVELRMESRVIGDINTVIIAIAEDSHFQGEIHMLGKEEKPVRFVEKRSEINSHRFSSFFIIFKTVIHNLS